jgi:cytochrome P450
MTAGADTLPTATVAETLAFIGEVATPTVAKGVIIRRPKVVGMAENMDLDRRAVRRMQQLRNKYGAGPLMLRIPGRHQALILSPEHVHRVLEQSPEPFATAESAKWSALRHFEPKGVLISEGEERTERRRFNEQALQSDRPVHQLGQRFTSIVEEEAQRLLKEIAEDGDGLSWDEFITAWFRVVRRVIFGEHAADDHEFTALTAQLRADANWAFLKPRNHSRREYFLKRLRNHLAQAEEGSLAAVIARMPKTAQMAPDNQIPQWLFAFDPAGMTTFRALALLASHPRHAGLVRQELEERRGAERLNLPYLRACVLESLRLWPTTPLVLRQTKEETRWENGVMPAGTSLLIFAPFFHRDDQRLSFADKFEPELWLKERGSNDWPLIPFSAGPAICPGRNLVLLLSSTMLSALIEHHELWLEPPDRLDEQRPLPGTLNNYSLRFSVEPRRPGILPGYMRPQAPMDTQRPRL